MNNDKVETWEDYLALPYKLRLGSKSIVLKSDEPGEIDVETLKLAMSAMAVPNRKALK